MRPFLLKNPIIGSILLFGGYVSTKIWKRHQFKKELIRVSKIVIEKDRSDFVMIYNYMIHDYMAPRFKEKVIEGHCTLTNQDRKYSCVMDVYKQKGKPDFYVFGVPIDE